MDRRQHEGRLGNDFLRALTGRRGPQVKGNAMCVQRIDPVVRCVTAGIPIDRSVRRTLTNES
jgi:hypothetical protein